VRGGKIVGTTKRASADSWALERANAGMVSPDAEDRQTLIDF